MGDRVVLTLVLTVILLVPLRVQRSWARSYNRGNGEDPAETIEFNSDRIKHSRNKSDISIPLDVVNVGDKRSVSFNESSEEQLLLPSNCSHCLLQKDVKTVKIEAIKAQILSKLGLSAPPNITKKAVPIIPPLHKLLDKNEMQGDAPEDALLHDYPDITDDYHVTTEKVISFAQLPPEELNIPSHIDCQFFKFPSDVLNSYVASAHLWVYVRPSIFEIEEEATNWVVVYKVVDDDADDTPNLIQIRAMKVEVSSQEGKWESIDLRKLVAHWLRHPNENLGIVIHSYNGHGEDLVVTSPEQEEESLIPFVEMQVEKQWHQRSRRMIGLNCEENDNEVRCCRYPLTVDFEEFGWDWIIAPKRYVANYCSGECPYVFLQKYPHTHLVQQANPQGLAGLCCAPRKMSAISMLYFDEDYNIIYGMLPGMIVELCGCT